MASDYKLDQVVREYLIEIGNSTFHKYHQFLQYGISGLRELHMDMAAVPKMKILPVNENFSVDLPEDYIQYTRISLCGADGTLHSLGRLNELCLRRKFDDCGIAQVPDALTDDNNTVSLDFVFVGYGDGYTDHLRNGEVTGRFFGIGGGNNSNGNYRIDKATNSIQLSSDTEAINIVLEYIGSLEAIDGDFEVHPFILETLKSYIFWASIRRKVNMGMGAIQLAEMQFKKERRKSNKRYQTFNFDEALATIRTATKLAPKT